MKKRMNVRIISGLIAMVLSVAELMPVFSVMAASDTDDYSISHEVISSWDGGYQGEFSFNNLSDYDMVDWQISFTIPAEITDSWGGTFVLSDSVEYEDENEESVNNTYVVTAGDYNATIPAGSSITIGYVANGDAGDVTDIEVDYTLVTDENNDDENDEDDDENESDDSDENTSTEPSGGIYVGNGYTVEVQIPQSWEHAYNAKLLIINTSDETLHNWGFLLKTDDDISGLYNATELSDHDGTRLFKNKGYNQDIPAGGTVEVGYTAYYNESFDVPSEFALASFERNVEMPEYRIESFVTDEWDDGALAEIVIENISDMAIEDWKLEFDSDMNIKRIWDGMLVSHDGDHYVVRNAEYAQNIAAGDRWIVGVEINGSISDIENVVMTEIAVADNAQLPDETTVSENTVSENSVSENTVSENIVNPDDIDFETDTDGDGIPDAYEEYFGTDKNDPDTDDDGLTDYEEIFIVGTDPTVYDSVTSGVSDYAADIDGDGVSNGAELQTGLDPLNEDTDFDGLKDGEEAAYGTDPLNPDTDGEGLDDGDDIALGFSPLMKDTDGNGILDCDEKVWQTYSYATEDDEKISEIILDLHASGKLDSTTEINNIMGRDVMSSGVVGLVGNPYDISTTSSFDSGVINFRINISELGGTEAGNLGVLWYDEKNDRFEMLDSVWNPDKGVLSAEITHFSRYMVVDKEMWFAAWRSYTVSANSVSENSISDESIIFDTVFIVDCSSSMGKKDPTKYSEVTSPQTYWYYDCYRYNVAYNFVTAMEEGDRAAIVTFSTEAEVECNLTSDKNRLYRSIRDFHNAGATSFDVPLQKAYEMLIAYGNPEAIRQVILLSDGDAFVQPGILNSLNAAHIKVHTVCLGEPEYRYVLQHISEQTGGTFFDAYKATEVVDLYSQFGMDDDFDTTDTDCDGLPDAIESAGIRIANGEIYYTDPTNADTDGDGSPDGEEINPEMELITYTDLALQDLSGWYFHMKSDPIDRDSDDDGYEDGEDPRPLWNDIRVISLKSDYVSVDATDTQTPGQGNATHYNGSEWTQYSDGSSYISFGGNQNWFISLDSDYYSYEIKKYGCGVIAMADVSLYLSNRDGSLGNINGISSINNIPFDDYVEYVYSYNVNNINLKYVYILNADTGGVQSYPVSKYNLATTDLIMGESNFFLDKLPETDNNMYWLVPHIVENPIYMDHTVIPIFFCPIQIVCKFHYLPIQDSGDTANDRINNYILNMLSDDCPVIFSVGPKSVGELNLYVTDGDINAKCEYEQYEQEKTVDDHYMTITAIIYDDVKEENDENDGVMYEVSSWGERFYISQQELDDYRDNDCNLYGIGTSILIIK